MKLIVAGSRQISDWTVTDEAIFNLECDNIVDTESPDFEIVTGMATGPDQHAEYIACKYGWKIKRFPADWNKHGKAAGHIRNRQMGDYADVLLAIWDGKSNGTKGMIDYMRSLNKPVHVFIAKKKVDKIKGTHSWSIEKESK